LARIYPKFQDAVDSVPWHVARGLSYQHSVDLEVPLQTQSAERFKLTGVYPEQSEGLGLLQQTPHSGIEKKGKEVS